MRIAIVTGANKGIGLETCRALAKSGQFKTVYLTSRNVELGQAAIEGTFMNHKVYVIMTSLEKRLWKNTIQWFITVKELEKDLGPNVLKYHQLDIADQNSISVFSQLIQNEHQGRESNEKKTLIGPPQWLIIFKPKSILIWSQ